MSDAETPAEKPAAPATETKPAAAKPPPKLKPPPRPLPDQEGIARWIEGEDYPVLAALFDQLVLPKFDGLFAQIKKQELLPQHWQVISTHKIPEGLRFEDLASVRRLNAFYADPAVANRRLTALEVGWQELRGKRPSRWNASDVFAVIRRIIQKKRDVDFHDLLSAVRDVWGGMSLPQGREQLEVLWGCLDYTRTKTRK
ncbi:MAG: hypothetical protein OES47_04340 [Acidobacteriota bacterium]|nr:hypothetical protein [Acidobacteriota bacterium]